MPRAKSGDAVSVHYTGKLDDGTVFDSSVQGEPLHFTIGAGEVIPGFEEAVVGMEPGESKSITLPPEQAYGPRRDEMVVTVDRDRLPTELDPVVGQQFSVQQQDGQQFSVRVTEISDAGVTLDANHELAGERLTFELELVRVK